MLDVDRRTYWIECSRDNGLRFAFACRSFAGESMVCILAHGVQDGH